MKYFIIVISLTFLITTSAYAISQILHGGATAGITPPTCDKGFNFTQTCGAAFLGVL